MTQTDYDKAFCKEWDAYCKEMNYDNLTEGEQDLMSDVFQFAFRKGYEFGKRQSNTDHERNLVALGDEYAISVLEAKERGFKKFNLSPSSLSTADAYERGWRDADSFDDEWTKAHPKDLLDRILDEYPDMIENEVKARMRDLQNEQGDNFRDDTKKLRAEIAKDIFTRCLAHEDGDVRAFCSRNMQMHARECVEAADALLAELENSANFSTP